MTRSKQSLIKTSIFWLVVAVIATLILGFRLQLSFDLSAFFPQKTDLTHDVLLEQLKNGPGSRLIVIGLNGAEPDQLALLSDQMKLELSSNSAFLNVLNGELTLEEDEIPEPINSYYQLLSTIDYSERSLQKVIEMRYRDLAFGGGSTLLELIARDPFLQALEILQRLVPANVSDGAWFAADGSAVLLAETRAAAVDLVAQTEAVEAVKTAYLKVSGSRELALEITGVGAFAVELQQTIRAEAKKRTILAMTVLVFVLLIVYRKPRLLLLATVPIGMGFLVGLTVVTLVFDTVHGITLAFGFTLMGIAIDYPLHLFSHSRTKSSTSAITEIWPTLRIGALSTAIAYLAIALSGSNGLAQLGVFSASGILVAVLVTRTWLPLLMSDQSARAVVGPASPQQSTSHFLPSVLAMLLTVMAGYYFIEGQFWDDQLSSLSPVPEQRLLTDQILRSAAGSEDMRYQVVLHESTLEELLLSSEKMDDYLQTAVADGLLDSWQSISLILPSNELQKARQIAIPDDDVLAKRLADAVVDTPFSPEAFAPFASNSQLTKKMPLLSPEHFDGTVLSSWLDSHLVYVDDHWVALVNLNQPKPDLLRERIHAWDGNAKLVDLQQSSLQLVSDYRGGAIKTLAFASLLIIVLLLFEYKQPRRILWVTLTVIASLLLTVVIVATIHDGLTIIHLVALLLVMGLGLDYALFLSRAETPAERQDTHHAVFASAITTALTFSILAVSSIPVLKFLGLTVAIGSAVSFVLARVGIRADKTSVHTLSEITK